MGKGFERYTGAGNDVEHEAGYDAYMTGVIYLAFIKFIHEKQVPKVKENGSLKRKRSVSDEVEEGEESASESESESESESDSTDNDEEDDDESTNIFMDKSVLPYYGKIYLMRSDIPYINLKGEEEVGKIFFYSKIEMILLTLLF